MERLKIICYLHFGTRNYDFKISPSSDVILLEYFKFYFKILSLSRYLSAVWTKIIFWGIIQNLTFAQTSVLKCEHVCRNKHFLIELSNLKKKTKKNNYVYNKKDLL